MEEIYGQRWRRSAAEPFSPHAFKSEMRSLRPAPPTPKILITPEAYADMVCIAELSGSDEIGWLGTVRELGGAQYLIERIFMVRQEVDGTATVMSEDGLGELFTELAQSDFESCERMRFWGHVHPGNSTSPSGQDESQMDQFAHNDWFIRGIFGRSGRAEFWFFNYRDGLRWDDCPWQIYFPADEDRKARWRAEVKAKVRQIPRPVISHIGGYHHPFGVGPSPTGATKSGSDRALGRSRKKRLSKGGEKR